MTGIHAFPGDARDNAMTFTIGDKAYVGGGKRSSRSGVSGEMFRDFYEYSPNLGWRKVADLPVGMRSGVGFSIGEKGYVGIGRAEITPGFFDETGLFYEFDPSRGEIDENGLSSNVNFT